MDSFWSGMLVTLEVAVLGLALSLLLGIIFGMMSTSKNRILQVISRVYVEFFQNTPLVVQVFFYYNAMPQFLKLVLNSARVVRLPKIFFGVMGVGLYHGAYIAEVIRTGIEAVPKGQSEAAHSQGFTGVQTLLMVVLPQSFKIILPPLANQALNLVKNTSVLALIAGFDLMYHADKFVSDTSFLQGYIVCAVMYFVICFPLARLAKYLEERSKQNPTDKKRKQKVEVA